MSDKLDPTYGAFTTGARNRQEDYYTVFRYDSVDGAPPVQLLIVADGMGGHAGGPVASRAAVEAFETAGAGAGDRTPGQRLQHCLDAANRAVGAKAAENPSLQGMGCTLVAVEVRHGRARWISVGDSPLWLLRGKKLRRLNADHSMAGHYAELVRQGQMTEDEAKSKGGSNQLRSALMGDALSLVDTAGLEDGEALSEGDILILASDGVLTLSEEEIRANAHQARQSAQAVVQRLLDKVREADRANQDNTTVVAYVHSKKGGALRGSARQAPRELDGPTSTVVGRVMARGGLDWQKIRNVWPLIPITAGLTILALWFFGAFPQASTTPPSPEAEAARADTPTHGDEPGKPPI